MARQTNKMDISPVLDAAHQWINRCLISDHSILGSNQLWTEPLVDELHKAFVENPDLGKDDFMTKLKGQMSGASPAGKQLMAEMLWALLLFPSNINPDTKRRHVREIWALSGQKFPEDLPLLTDSVLDGIGSGGPGYNNHRWRELAFLIELTRDLKHKDEEDRRRIFSTYDAFMSWINSVRQEGERQFRHMLRFFAFPDRVERMSSNRDRGAILQAFGAATQKDTRSWTDRQFDDALLNLRNKLQSENPSAVLDFYEPPLRAKWQPVVEEIKSIHDGIEAILNGYVPAKESEPFSSRVPIGDVFNRLVDLLRLSSVVAKHASIKVSASYGKGNWANVPWISFLDSRETTTTQHGIYVVFLFKDDGTGVYLTYNQGVTDIIKAKGRRVAQETLQQRAQERRAECTWLSESGFLLDDTISLSEDPGLGRDYETSTIAHKLYLKGSVPNDNAILSDLESVLTAYDQYVEHVTAKTPLQPVSPPSKGHWLFQANPKIFDIKRALNNLRELTWTINQAAGKFQAGQTGYIWESGSTGGIVAQATLLTDPAEMDADPRDNEYSTDESKFTGRRLRVRLRIDRVLDEPISRQSLLEHPTLKSLGIIRFANATNYTLTDDEYDAITSLAIHVEPILDLEAITLAFSDALRQSFVDFGEDHLTLIRSFVSSLATKPLVILTGLSGSGKTQLAIRFGEWLGGSRLHVAAVRPDWTGAEALFGYEDALKPLGEDKPAWNVPSTLGFLLRAARDPQNPYVLILDEMNLAHVERYFADVLSGMESGKPVLPNLVKGTDGYWRQREDAEDKIPFPQNVFVIGTVNIDETTYMFSPKVLDRANTFEFRVKTSDLASTHRKPLVCSEGQQELTRGFLEVATNSDWHLEAGHSKADELGDRLRILHTVLSTYGFEFGHRVFYEAMRFAALNEATGVTSLEAVLDRIVMQKLLPRIHGSRRRIEGLLVAFSQYCFDYNSVSSNSLAAYTFDPESVDVSEAKLPYSFNKLLRMLRSLRANQFTSFTE
jgi:hypothetical protein